MGLFDKVNPFKKMQSGNKQQTQTANPAPATIPAASPQPVQQQPAAAATPGRNTTQPLNKIQAGNISLVTNTPEEALRQVEAESAEVSFGESVQHRIMSSINQNWMLIGPILFAVATLSEIFFVLWSFLQKQNQTPYYAFTLIAASIIVEVGLMTISFQAHIIRAAAAKRSDGMTRDEKKQLAQIKFFWYCLSALVALTQVMFIITQSDTNAIGLSTILFVALARAGASMFADYQTAFITHERPNNAETALEIKAQKTQFAEKILEGEAKKITIINAGAVKVQESAQAATINQKRTEQKATMEMDALRTEQELARLENANRIAKAKAQYESEAEWSRLQISFMRQQQAQLAEVAKSLVGESEKDKEIKGTLHYLIQEVRALKPEPVKVTPLRAINGDQSQQEDDV